MDTFVIDTSVLMRAFLDNPDREKVDALIESAVRGKVKLYGPISLWHEMYSVFVQYYESSETALQGIRKFEHMLNRGIIEIEYDNEAVEEALRVAFTKTSGQQGHIGTFDSYFHGLALHLNCIFLTNDKKHYNKTKDSIGHIMLFEDLKLPALP